MGMVWVGREASLGSGAVQREREPERGMEWGESILYSNGLGAPAAPYAAHPSDTEYKVRMKPERPALRILPKGAPHKHKRRPRYLGVPQFGTERTKSIRGLAADLAVGCAATPVEQARCSTDVLCSDVQRETRPTFAPPLSTSTQPPPQPHTPA